jgi:hypothetical protein
MYDEKGGQYLDCINNVAHGEQLYHCFLLNSYMAPLFFFKNSISNF